jgi:hypothetical protein
MSKVHSNFGPVAAVLRAVWRLIVTIVVIAWWVLDEIVLPLVRPLIAALGRLRVFERIGAAIGRLPPYVCLLLLGVPFVLIEPLKVVALWWGAVGHPIQGVILLIVAELASLLIVERIFHAGHAPLMRIEWFRRLVTWLFGLRDRALGWVKASPAWKRATALAGAVRGWWRGLVASLR